jgi:hypothetical protein
VTDAGVAQLHCMRAHRARAALHLELTLRMGAALTRLRSLELGNCKLTSLSIPPLLRA